MDDSKIRMLLLTIRSGTISPSIHYSRKFNRLDVKSKAHTMHTCAWKKNTYVITAARHNGPWKQDRLPDYAKATMH